MLNVTPNEHTQETVNENKEEDHKTDKGSIMFKKKENPNKLKKLNNTAIGIKNKTTADIGELQHDIAMMDAQLAHLSSMCNNIQNNYYNINEVNDNIINFLFLSNNKYN